MRNRTNNLLAGRSPDGLPRPTSHAKPDRYRRPNRTNIPTTFTQSHRHHTPNPANAPLPKLPATPTRRAVPAPEQLRLLRD